MQTTLPPVISQMPTGIMSLSQMILWAPNFFTALLQTSLGVPMGEALVAALYLLALAGWGMVRYAEELCVLKSQNRMALVHRQ